MQTHTTIPVITYEQAAHLVAVALRVGSSEGVRAVVSVVDPMMQLVAFGRTDGATPHSVETSRRKADTAASTRRPSALMRQDLATALENGTGGRLTRIAGGVPLSFGGVHIGGLGVAGGSPEQDAQIAAAVLTEVGADEAVTA